MHERELSEQRLTLMTFCVNNFPRGWWAEQSRKGIKWSSHERKTSFYDTNRIFRISPKPRCSKKIWWQGWNEFRVSKTRAREAIVVSIKFNIGDGSHAMMLTLHSLLVSAAAAEHCENWHNLLPVGCCQHFAKNIKIRYRIGESELSLPTLDCWCRLFDCSLFSLEMVERAGNWMCASMLMQLWTAIATHYFHYHNHHYCCANMWEHLRWIELFIVGV